VNAYRDQLSAARARLQRLKKLISITADDLFIKSNYQDFERYPEIDIAMAADEATLPSLIEAVKRLITPERKAAFEARRTNLPPRIRRARTVANRCDVCLGREPDQHGSPVCRALGADQERRLVTRLRRSVCQPLASALVEL
jgi:hypothetical protein